jgi:hypothetical protein
MRATYSISVLFVCLLLQLSSSSSGRSGEGADEYSDVGEEKEAKKPPARKGRSRTPNDSTSDSLSRKPFQSRDNGAHNIRATFAAAETEYCDWKRSPVSTIKGEVCGKHYKVLGLRRVDEDIEQKIKRAYRSRSLNLHPDKNPLEGAADAFKIVSEAYECLSDKACKKSYDESLQSMEEEIANWRQDVVSRMKAQLTYAVSEVHYYASVFAQNFYQRKIHNIDAYSSHIAVKVLFVFS